MYTKSIDLLFSLFDVTNIPKENWCLYFSSLSLYFAYTRIDNHIPFAILILRVSVGPSLKKAVCQFLDSKYMADDLLLI